MNFLIDKAVPLIFSVIGLAVSENSIASAVVFVVMISASAAIQLFYGKKTASAIIVVISASCLFFPHMILAMPLILYDALREKKPYLAFPALLFIFSGSELSYQQIILAFSGVAAAFIIYRRTSALEEMLGNLREQRDEHSEQNIVLSRQNAKLIEAQDNAVRLATLKERNRIAREIHDNVGHMLTRSLLQSGALIIINKDEKMKEPLESLKSTLDTAMTSIRESVHDLHDESIDLKMTIMDCISSAEERFRVSFTYDAGDDIPTNVKLCAAGIVKEGISNAVKHSNGDRIAVVFREHPVFFQLMIEDNGSAAQIHENGIGLKNMEDRARNTGGTINYTASEKGFRIFVSIPKKQGENL